MRGALGGYASAGRASAGRALAAAWLDWAAGALIAVLAFPFPFARASLPVGGFAAAVAAAVLAGAWLYLAVTACVLGRTPGMYLLDLGFASGAPPFWRAVLWGGAWALVAVPALAVRAVGAPGGGAPDRVSGLTTCAARAEAVG